MDSWTIVLSIIGGGALCIYLLLTRKNYFEKRGIPCIKPTLILGNMAQVMFKVKGIPEVITEVYNCHPDAKYVGFYDGLIPIIVLRDPDLIKSITIQHFDSFPNHRMFVDSPTEPLFQKNLFALKDDTWKEMRALLSPAFTSSKMKIMFKLISQCAKDFADHLAKLDPRPEELDMKDTFGRYSLDVIATSAFGLSVNSMENRNNEFYLMGKEVTDFSGTKMIMLSIMRNAPWLAKILNIKFLSSKSTEFFMNVIKKTIATRESRGIARPDMIQLMMQAKDKKEKSNLSSEDMAAQAFIFFLGGSDSPATTMSFAAQLLALNQDIQRKLQAEIDQVLDKNSGQVSYEDLHAMKYLNAVVNETLRIFPPAVIHDRIGSKSFTLPPALPGLEPLKINAGQNIWLPCYSLHHDPLYFPNPEKFDPDRFSDENKSEIHPFTYFPFGLGPRICIANRFALMEIKLVLFHLLSQCDLLPTPKTPPEIKLSTNPFPIMPVGGFYLKVEPRV